MNKTQSAVLTVLLSAMFISLFYGDILLSPNSYVFSNSGDGIKNYYTYAYHIKNDTSYVHFQGMNYPYGEVHIFTDGNPFLSNTVKFLSTYISSLNQYSIGIYNLFMLLSFVVGALFIHIILNNFIPDKRISVIGALSIMVLSPQILRAGGHLSLVTFFCIPVSYYLNITSFKQPWIKHALLAITGILWFFIHPYLGMMTALFGFLYACIYAVLLPRKKGEWTYLFSSFIVPVAFYFIYVKIFDYHPYRGDVPWGFFHYQANINTIFFPNHTFLSVVLQKLGIRIAPWEGWAYIGLAGDVAFFSILAYFTQKTVKQKKFHLQLLPFPVKLISAFLSALLILMYASGFPFFLYKPMADWFPIIQQFRSLGRFAWVFYYVMGTVTFYWFYLWTKRYRTKHKNISSMVVALFIATIYLMEGIPYHISMHKMISNRYNPFDVQQLNNNDKNLIENINPGDYQAILPLPLFFIGAEVFSKTAPDNLIYRSMVMSYHLSLPLLSSNGSRASIEEARKVIQVVSPPHIQKAIAKDIKSSKPFLIIGDTSAMNIYEKYYYRSASPIRNNLRVITPKNLFAYNRKFKALPVDTLMYFSFDTIITEIKHRGKGAFYTIPKTHRTPIVENLKLPASASYQISFWVYYKNIDRALPNMIVATKNRWQIIDFSNPLIIDNDGWMKFAGTFSLSEDEKHITLYISGETLEKKQIIIDDLMITQKIES